MRHIRASRKALVVAYVIATVALGCVTLIALALNFGHPKIPQFVFFWLLYAIADRVSTTNGRVRGIPRAGLRTHLPELSAGFVVLIAAAFATSPVTAALIGLATPVVPGPWRGWLRWAFNGAQTSLYCGLASATYVLTQARFGAGTSGLIWSALAASVVAVSVNTVLVSGVMALERERGILGVLRELAWPTVGSIPFALAALLVAVLYRQWGALASVFMLAPFFVLRQARQGQIELETARERTLRAFVRAVELKDPYTSRHSERVAEIVVELHRALGATDEELEKRYYGALLHDIGKVAVSARILMKPSRLTAAEFEVVQRHPGTSGFVVGAVSFLKEVVPEILYHHERIDGAGYPCGLVGDEIPFEARVLAVADTFEALTSDRPYRRGLTQTQALAEVRRSVGSQLDERPVDALTNLVESGHTFEVLPRRTLEAEPPTTQSLAREA